jgi:8-oxo-dGTP pyrophosphatase MutT (NUDIX family)
MSRRRLLQTLLEQYALSPAADLSVVQPMLALLQAGGDPFSRENYVPGHFTASGFVLSPSGDQMLLIFHSKLKRWLQPGGHVDPTDADIEAAARRELAEEVGLVDLERVGSGIFDLDIHAIPRSARGPEHSHFDVRFLFRAHSEHALAGSDAHEARWYPFAEVAQLNSDSSVLRVLEKLPRGL